MSFFGRKSIREYFIGKSGVFHDFFPYVGESRIITFPIISFIISHASGYQTITPEVVVERDVRVAVVENPSAIVKGLVASYEGEARDVGKVYFIDVIGDKSNIDKKKIILASVLWKLDVIYEMMLIDIYAG